MLTTSFPTSPICPTTPHSVVRVLLPRSSRHFAGNDELAAACGMFISPAKTTTGAGAGANNKPRKLFLEEEAGRAAGRPALLGGMVPVELSPALWVQAA